MKMLARETVYELVVNALEGTAFVMVDPLDDAPDATGEYHVRIAFKGPGEEAELFLSATSGFLCEVVANLLGQEPEDVDPDRDGTDALAEFASIVAGELILTLGGREIPFQLGLPEPGRAPTPSTPDQNQVECYLESEDGFLWILLRRKEAHVQPQRS